MISARPGRMGHGLLDTDAGRQPFQIADGMLIRLTAGNGFERAALQLNPRWAADNLLLAEAS